MSVSNGRRRDTAGHFVPCSSQRARLDKALDTGESNPVSLGLGTAVQATRLPPQCSLCVAAGKVEMQMGVNAVFRGMPLSWVRGYLGRALAVMEGVAAEDSGDAKLSKDAVSA